MITSIQDVFFRLDQYITGREYKGYDPYDTLNGFIPFEKLGRLPAAIAIQIQKKNPLNIRPLIGVKPGINPKGMGLILKAYAMQARNDSAYLGKATKIFEWLTRNGSKGYKGACWGYNFNWVNPEETIPAFTPSVVVTSFVIDGIFEYYKLTKDKLAAEIIMSAAVFVLEDIPVTNFGNEALSFAYTKKTKGSCYNASLLAAEVLAKADNVSKDLKNFDLVRKAVNFVLDKQRPDGCWYYSYDNESGLERKQIDFHQGFVLVSLYNIMNLYPGKFDLLEKPITKGLDFYSKSQFDSDGRAKWRLPKEFPTDIHNQSQGIITFAKLRKFDLTYRALAVKIADYTVNNFFDSDGYFYFRKNRFMVNKIPYIRWAQAWMLLALAEILRAENE
ncbi:MAG: hypothetical protein J0L60_13585 [Ignavibacteria bacterium]|nr:hypothetical protein [Ignavibacteria bacterium]